MICIISCADVPFQSRVLFTLRIKDMAQTQHGSEQLRRLARTVGIGSLRPAPSAPKESAAESELTVKH